MTPDKARFALNRIANTKVNSATGGSLDLLFITELDPNFIEFFESEHEAEARRALLQNGEDDFYYRISERCDGYEKYKQIAKDHRQQANYFRTNGPFAGKARTRAMIKDHDRKASEAERISFGHFQNCVECKLLRQG
ncbi:MAG: hypothetical protein ABSE92_16190 [Terriglobales bacterium]|jgi:hypothetical protein